MYLVSWNSLAFVITCHTLVLQISTEHIIDPHKKFPWKKKQHQVKNTQNTPGTTIKKSTGSNNTQSLSGKILWKTR